MWWWGHGVIEVYLLVTHTGIAASVGRAFSHVCLSVCLFVCALTGKRLKLSTPNMVHVYSIAVCQLSMHWPRGQKVKRQGHTVMKTITAHYCSWPWPVFRIPNPVRRCATCGRCLHGSACRYDCLGFSSSYFFWLILSGLSVFEQTWCYPWILSRLALQRFIHYNISICFKISKIISSCECDVFVRFQVLFATFHMVEKYYFASNENTDSFLEHWL